jgi:hypothetical protein
MDGSLPLPRPGFAGRHHLVAQAGDLEEGIELEREGGLTFRPLEARDLVEFEHDRTAPGQCQREVS